VSFVLILDLIGLNDFETKRIPNPKAAGSPSGGVRGRQEGAGFCDFISLTVMNLISHSVKLKDGIQCRWF